jgi:hypothetical protein
MRLWTAIILTICGFALILVPAALEASYAHRMWAFVAGAAFFMAALAVLETRNG